jgi:hypothetical protein
MLKRILLSGAALAALSSFAVAQTAPTPAEPSTPPAAQQPMGSGGAGAGGAGMADPSAQAQAAEDPGLYSNIQGAEVVGQNDEKIGTVADLLFDEGGELKSIVIGHGGVVGIGQTYRRLDVAEMPLVSDGKLNMGQLNTAALEGIPEYTYPEAETGRAATDTSAPAGSGMAPSPADSTASAPSASAPASEPSAPASDVSASAAAGGEYWPASYLVGANITNADQSAEIQDLRIEKAKIASVVLDKGSLGLGNDVTEVPFEDLAISGTPAEPKIALKSGASAPGLATEPADSSAPAATPPAAGSPPAESAPSTPPAPAAPSAPAQ